MGYCFGGAAALELARSGKAGGVSGYASLHGAHDSGGPSLSFRHAADLIAHGAGDTSVTMDDVAASRELEKAGVEYEIQVYSAAPHGSPNGSRTGTNRGMPSRTFWPRPFKARRGAARSREGARHFDATPALRAFLSGPTSRRHDDAARVARPGTRWRWPRRHCEYRWWKSARWSCR